MKPQSSRSRRDVRSAPKSAPVVFFTVVAENYFAYAQVLMESLSITHPDSIRYIFLCHRFVPQGLRSDFAEVLPASVLPIDNFEAMAFAYEVMEFSTAIKPYALLWLADKHPGSLGTVYLDPDILALRPLVDIVEALRDGASFVVTPHMMAPLQDGFSPDDLTIMKSGVYNLGFCALGRRPDGVAFVEWWRDRCRRDAVVDIPGHRFTDQRWVDLAPAFCENIFILRHPGYNLAYWNLLHRPVELREDGYYAAGRPLHFVHFSGVQADKPDEFSKHQDRFTAENIGDLRPLHRLYIDRLLAHDWEQKRRQPYPFNAFASGRKVHRLMRLSFRRHEDVAPVEGFDPFADAGEVFDGAEPTQRRLGRPRISRVMYELWLDRPDLQKAFDIQSAAERETYVDWFCGHGAAEAGLDRASADAARRLNSMAERADSLPWVSQSDAVYDGPAAQARSWLAAPVPLKTMMHGAGTVVPRLFALLWEKRPDLRLHFQNRSQVEIEAFLGWCITSGVMQNAVDLSIVEATLAPLMNGEDPIFMDGGRRPQPRLMRLTLEHFRNSPLYYKGHDDAGETNHKAMLLWLAGRARYDFKWPDSFLQSVLAYLHEDVWADDDVDVPIFRLLTIIRDLRPDIRANFDLANEEHLGPFLVWFVNFGIFEFGLDPRCVSPKLVDWLAEFVAVDQGERVRRIELLLWLGNDALNIRFESVGEAVAFMATEGRAIPRIREWLDLVAAPKPKVVRVRRQPDVCLSGLWGITSGVAEAMRATSAALKAVKIDHVFFDIGSKKFYSVDNEEIDIAAPAIRVNIVHLNADTAMNNHLAFIEARLTGAWTIGYWAWELSKMPPYWRHAYSFYDEIWASTVFAHDAFAGEGLRPVNLLPMPIEVPKVEGRLTRADFDLPEDAFVVFFSFDFRSFASRKNPEAAVEAFKRAFPLGSENVILVLKTLGAKDRPVEFEALASRCRSDPRIRMLDRDFEFAALNRFVSLCDCYLSLHRSEGFGRGMAEAMALGLPVVATGYSGNADFVRPGVALPVDYDLVPVVPGAYPGAENQEWAEPSVAHAADLLRQLWADPALRASVGRAAREFMRKTYSAEATGKLFRHRLRGIQKELDLEAAEA